MCIHGLRPVGCPVCIHWLYPGDCTVAWHQVIFEGLGAVHAEKATGAAPNTEGPARDAAPVDATDAVTDALGRLRPTSADASAHVHATADAAGHVHATPAGVAGEDPARPERSLHTSTPQAQGTTKPPTAAATDAAPIHLLLAPNSVAPFASAPFECTSQTADRILFAELHGIPLGPVLRSAARNSRDSDGQKAREEPHAGAAYEYKYMYVYVYISIYI